MAEPCRNCGSELFAGQRFCRACGNPTDTLDAGEAPTQQFADGPASPGEATTRHMSPPDDWGARSMAHTAPQSRPNTNPVGRPPDSHQPPQGYQAPPTSYQMPPPPPVWQPAQYAPQAAPARSGASWAIVLAIILALMLGAVVGGRMIVRRIRDRIQFNSQRFDAPAADDVKTFALGKGAAVNIQTVNGNINVTSSDGPQAEVRILASGGASPSDVSIRSDNNGLFITAPAKGKISFEVRLPRDLGSVTFNSTNGNVSVSDVGGQLTVETTNGRVKLDQVAGIDRIKTTNGSIDATLRQGANPRPITFETTNGGIDLKFQDDFNGTLDASTIQGGIRVDDSFDGIKVDKKFPMGAQASGPIGAGGPTVTVKTMRGGIKIGR